MQRLKFICSISIITIICLTKSCFSFSEYYTWSVLDNSIPTSTSLSEINEISDNNFLNLEAESAILIEQNSGKILYEHNIHEKLHPASVTKVMSLLLIMEALDSRKNHS